MEKKKEIEAKNQGETYEPVDDPKYDIELNYVVQGETSSMSYYTYIKENSPQNFGTYLNRSFNEAENYGIQNIIVSGNTVMLDYDGPEFSGNGYFKHLKYIEMDDDHHLGLPYILLTKFFAFDYDTFLALTPSRIILMPNDYYIKGSKRQTKDLGFILPNFDYLTLEVSEDKKFMVFLAKKNSFNNQETPEYRLVVYKIGSLYAHYILRVTMEDKGSNSKVFKGLFDVTSCNKIVLSSILRSDTGENIFQIHDDITVKAEMNDLEGVMQLGVQFKKEKQTKDEFRTLKVIVARTTSVSQ